MKLEYVGIHPEVRVPLTMGGEVIVKKYKTANFPDSLGRSLLQQPSNWKKKGGKK